jgi:hypothetical protein
LRASAFPALAFGLLERRLAARPHDPLLSARADLVLAARGFDFEGDGSGLIDGLQFRDQSALVRSQKAAYLKRQTVESQGGLDLSLGNVLDGMIRGGCLPRFRVSDPDAAQLVRPGHPKLRGSEVEIQEIFASGDDDAQSAVPENGSFGRGPVRFEVCGQGGFFKHAPVLLYDRRYFRPFLLPVGILLLPFCTLSRESADKEQNRRDQERFPVALHGGVDPLYN